MVENLKKRGIVQEGSDNNARFIVYARRRTMKIAESEYISFASAGTRGLVYLGVLDAIEDHLHTDGFAQWNRSLRGVSGTSAGAIVALMLALGFDREVRHEILRDHLDVRRVVSRPDFALLLRQYGCEDGEAFKEIIQRILLRGGLSSTSTMADLQRLLRIDVVFVCTNLHTGTPFYLSASSTPTLKVCDAVYASACVPFVFAPQMVHDVMTSDGCLSCHLPEAFDESKTFFVSVEEGPPPDSSKKLTSWSDFLHGIVRCTVVAQRPRLERLRREHAERFLLLQLPPEILRNSPPFELDMSERTADALLHAGYVCACDAFVDSKLIRSVEQAVQYVVATTLAYQTHEEDAHDVSEEYPPSMP